jgi:tetratricopeptide (TPR) repeat protein
LYADGQYSATIHAFHESLARQPNSADVYYDMGITLRDRGDTDAAAAAYGNAIALNPQFWEAHNNLGMTCDDSMWQSPNTSKPSVWRRKHPLSATIWATPIATKAITMPPSPNLANSSGWTPVGSVVIVVWLGRSCPSVTMNRRY